MPKAAHATITSCARCHPWPLCAQYDINTVAGLIEALGGHNAVTRLLDLDAGDTRRWEVSGDIPIGWHLRVFAHVLLLGRTVAPVVFGYSSEHDGWNALSRASALYAEGCTHG